MYDLSSCDRSVAIAIAIIQNSNISAITVLENIPFITDREKISSFHIVGSFFFSTLNQELSNGLLMELKNSQKFRMSWYKCINLEY